MRLLRTREGSRGSPPSDFRASVPLRRVGPEETGAERTRSIPWSPRTSLASNTRSALTTRRWCSKIGRASCRERGEISGGAVSLKKKKKKKHERRQRLQDNNNT